MKRITKSKKEQLRTCIVTREKMDKKKLIRLVKTKDNVVSIDIDFKIEGRGAYVSKEKEIIKIAISKKFFNRALKIKKIPDNVIEELLKI